MVETVWFYKLLPFVSFLVAIIGSVVSGYLVYNGLSTKLERRHLRLRINKNINESRKQFVNQAKSSQVETLLMEAKYPLGLNAIRLNIIFLCLFFLVLMNYGVIAFVFKGFMQTGPMFIGTIVLVVLYPGQPLSPVRFALNRAIEYRKSKRTAELFSLYDMLVSEIEMMRSTRVNVYSLLRTLLPYFKELNPLLAKMLSDWTTSTVGPEKAIDEFAKIIDTSEAKSLATVLRTFDENNRETLLESLRGMEDMFITSQIENSRRKRKLFIDTIGMPVKLANFLVALNFVVVIIMMVMAIMGNSSLNM